MGKNEIIKRLAKKMYGNASGSEIQQCAEFCDSLVEVIEDALINEEKIIWKGFFSAEVVKRGVRRARHPQTGEIVDFPETKSINCKMSKSIRDAVNEK